MTFVNLSCKKKFQKKKSSKKVQPKVHNMSIEIFDVDNINSVFCSGLRGYHVYQEFWKPLVSQTIFAQGEKNS